MAPQTLKATKGQDSTGTYPPYDGQGQRKRPHRSASTHLSLHQNCLTGYWTNKITLPVVLRAAMALWASIA